MNWTPIAIALGAVLGALSRYYMTLFWMQKRGAWFPYGTLFVNLTGAFVMGVAAFIINVSEIAIAAQNLILVGFLGSYTTFSSYTLDTFNLFRNRRNLAAILYWLGSPIAGLGCIFLGSWLASHLHAIG